MRKYRYYVITPFSRWQHFPAVIRLLFEQKVVWAPVFDADLPLSLTFPSWVEPHYCPPAPAGFFPGYWKTNWFFDHHVIEPEARYLVLNDDDWYEPGFFDKLDNRPGELLICSMNRGQHQPPGSPHPGGILDACPENLRVSYVGGEQLIVSGRLMHEHRYGPEYEADGHLIVKLSQAHPVEFVPEAQVYFNYLEPGRWDR